VPHWLRLAFFGVVERAMTDDEKRRAWERWIHTRRYEFVRDLRETVNERTGKKHTRAEALDVAVVKLQGAPEGGKARETIEDSYDMVRKDLERRGRESEFFSLVGD
jgi:hypothetical protein